MLDAYFFFQLQVATAVLLLPTVAVVVVTAAVATVTPLVQAVHLPGGKFSWSLDEALRSACISCFAGIVRSLSPGVPLFSRERLCHDCNEFSRFLSVNV